MLKGSETTRHKTTINLMQYFHLLLARCVLIATIYHFPFMGFILEPLDKRCLSLLDPMEKMTYRETECKSG